MALELISLKLKKKINVNLLDLQNSRNTTHEKNYFLNDAAIFYLKIITTKVVYNMHNAAYVHLQLELQGYS